MVNLVFQRGQNVRRLQTAIFCVVPLVQKVEYLFSSSPGKKNFPSSSHPLFCVDSGEEKAQKTASNFPLADP